MTNKTYVYQGLEVELTGRKAQRKTRSGKMNEVVEVKPTDPENGSFLKWVSMSDLFEILEDEE